MVSSKFNKLQGRKCANSHSSIDNAWRVPAGHLCTVSHLLSYPAFLTEFQQLVEVDVVYFC